MMAKNSWTILRADSCGWQDIVIAAGPSMPWQTTDRRSAGSPCCWLPKFVELGSTNQIGDVLVE